MAPGERIDVIVDATELGDVGLPLPHPHPRRGPERDVRHGHRAHRGRSERDARGADVPLGGSSRASHRRRRVAEDPAELAWPPCGRADSARSGSAGLARRPRPAAISRSTCACGSASDPSARDLPARRRYVDLGPRSRAARSAAGRPRSAGAPSTLAPLFPVFSGTAAHGSDGSRVEGSYAPPGGVVGRVADRAPAAHRRQRHGALAPGRARCAPRRARRPSSRPAARRGGAWRRRPPPGCGAGGSASRGCC